MEPNSSTETGSSPPMNEVGALQALIRAVRTRIIAGLILALPIVLTIWIVYWIYTTLQGLVVSPLTELYVYLYRREPTFWWYRWIAPFIAIVLALAVLYILGLVARSSLLRALDWFLLRLPVVTTIYKALSNVAQAIGQQMQHNRPQRVVLVEFPHPGMRALAFVTNTLRDAATDRSILCVCVLTGVMPPAGFTLFVPEESVTNLDWSMNQALQAILSGGITAPSALHFFDGIHVPSGTGPIIDPHGHPITPAEPPHVAEHD
jgi:uncharacterized membrane protein